MNKITDKKNIYFADWMEGKITKEEYQSLISEKEFLTSKKIDTTFNVIKELNTPLDGMLDSIKKTPQKKATNVIPLFVKWTGAIAATFLLLFSLSTFLKETKINEITNIGEQKTIVLLDDSQVILNAKSKITYNIKSWKNKRELFLDGEAYFKVTKKGNTFTVNTKNGSITVLGTHFNVKSNTNYLVVTCYEGKVKVIDHKDEEYILTAGKSLININGNSEKKLVSINKPTWVSGKISFSNTPLRVVLNELEKQFDIKIERNSVNLEQKYTGAFDNKKLKLSLNAVLKPMQIKYSIKGSKIILKP